MSEDVQELKARTQEVTDPEARYALECAAHCIENLRRELESQKRRLAQLEERANR